MNLNTRSFVLALGMAFCGLMAVTAVPAHAATIAVTTTTDERADPGPGTGCSLREAIQSVNGAANYGGCANTGAVYGTSDAINIPAGTYTTTIAGAELLNAGGSLDILASVTITGAGAGSTIIDGGGAGINNRAMYIGNAITVSISGVTIQNGRSADGAGLYNAGGTVTLTNSTITSNTATGTGGAICNLSGTLTVTDSIISGNATTFGGVGGGGGIFNNGTAAVTNCAISGNTSNAWGGGIFNHTLGVATITNSTISGNTATSNIGGGIVSNNIVTVINSTITNNSGAGIFRNAGSATISNSIIANQSADWDCSNGSFTSNGHNLDSDGSCGLGGAGDISNSALANLGALANNGGSTQTMALLTGSAATDAGDCNGGAVTTDQRGYTRPAGATCDIGAFELTQYQVSVTVGGTGTVADNAGLAGFAIACGATCSDYVFSGDSVTLVATPGAGMVVTWSGACTGSGNCLLSNITADKAVTATFAATPITPTPTPAPTTTTTTTPPNLSGGSSSVSGSGGSFTVTITNNGGSVYVYSIGGTGFSVTGDNCSGTAVAGHGTCQVTVTPSSPITSATTVTLLLYTNYGSAPVEIRVTLTPATASTPAAITVVSPANGAVTGSTVTFEWVPAGGGGYQIYICQNADFTSCVAITVNGSSANRALFAGAGLIFALGLIAPGGRRRLYVLAFALMMFTGAGLVACGSGGSSSATSANAKYTSTGLAKGAWFWKVTATGYQSETRTFTVQ